VADLRRVIGVTAVTLVAFLAAMTVRFNVPGVNDWGYFGEPRYYRLILPAAALFWLTLVEELDGLRWARTAALALLTVGIVYLLQAQVRFEQQYLTTTVWIPGWQWRRRCAVWRRWTVCRWFTAWSHATMNGILRLI